MMPLPQPASNTVEFSGIFGRDAASQKGSSVGRSLWGIKFNFPPRIAIFCGIFCGIFWLFGVIV